MPDADGRFRGISVPGLPWQEADTYGWKDGVSVDYSYDRYGDSPYYNPQDLGLEVLGDADVAGDYEFDMVVVWRDPQSGELFAAYDSGCSCPTPFSDLTRAGMKPIRAVEDLDSLIDELRYDKPSPHADSPVVGALKSKVREALR